MVFCFFKLIYYVESAEQHEIPEMDKPWQTVKDNRIFKRALLSKSSFYRNSVLYANS